MFCVVLRFAINSYGVLIVQTYQCSVCAHHYDAQSAPKNHENKAIHFLDLDVEWTCPVCGVRQDLFKPLHEASADGA